MKRRVEELGGRRSFFRKLGVAAAGLGAASVLPDATLEGAMQGVNRSSMPSQLKITDLRVAVVTGAPTATRRSDRKSTRLNSSHLVISYAVFCFKKKKAWRTIAA